MIRGGSVGVLILWMSVLIGGNVARANDHLRLVRFSKGDVGSLLRIGVEKSSVGALREIFSRMTETKKERLYHALRKTQISVIDRVETARSGKRRFDSQWVVKPSIDGGSSGILTAEELGTETDWFYSVEVTIKDVDVNDGGDQRIFLMDIELKLIGTGLQIVVGEEATLKWQVDGVISCER